MVMGVDLQHVSALGQEHNAMGGPDLRVVTEDGKDGTGPNPEGI